MTEKVVFLPLHILDIHLDSLFNNQKLTHTSVVSSFQVGRSISYVIKEDALYIKEAESIETVINMVTKIVKYLTRYNVGWSGAITSFKSGSSLGCIQVN